MIQPDPAFTFTPNAGSVVSTFATASTSGSIRVGTNDQCTFTTSSSNGLLVGNDAFTLSANWPIMTLHATGPIMTIYGDDRAELISVARDGKVTAAYPGAEEPAAAAFWKALESCGVNLIAHVRDLERRLSAHEPVTPYAL